MQEDPLIGRVVDGRYEIASRIARGGMASVYEAHDLRLDRTVAVKVMHPGMGDDAAFAARFVREARSAARLTHPNVVAVYDQGTDDGTVFLAMEYVPGRTLRDVIAERSPLPPAQALRLLEPVLSALAAAHEAGIVHRDVKPENVLISRDGTVKVADFGLARAISSETQHTSTGVLIGTVSYLAPELVTDGTADARADVYSAGVMLYELLTGHKPHAGETAIQVAYKHVHADVPAPGEDLPGIPAYVDALVARATARDRARRPVDAGAMLAMVQRVQRSLASGVGDDPELVAALAPAGTIGAIGASAASDDSLNGTWERPAFDNAAFAAAGLGGEAAGHSPTTTLRVRPETDGRGAGSGAGSGGDAPGRRPRRRRGPIMLFLALLVAVAVGVAAWWFGFGRYTSTPGVLDMSPSAAIAKLTAAGLHVHEAPLSFSATVQKGFVDSSAPGPDERILRGGTVTISVSKGIEEYKLPKARGRQPQAVTRDLEKIKMKVSAPIQRWSNKVKAGRVIGIDPAAGTIQRPGTSITIYLSKGPQPVALADWTGKPIGTAEQAVGAEKLIYTETERFSTTVPKGDVISQSPGAGVVFQGSTVTFVVSKGPRMVTVPGGLRGHTASSAEAKLAALGLHWTEEHSSFYIGLNYVGSVDPGSGTKVPAGSTVILYLV